MSPLIDLIERAASAGVDLIQIREKDLTPRELCLFVDSALRSIEPYSTSLLVNDRVDIAVACGAKGVHLTTQSLPADVIRSCFGQDLMIGASTHTLDEVLTAEKCSADFAVFGPVFETESKRKYGPPVGLDNLCEAVSRTSFPVIALGGINKSNYYEVLQAGAAGVAGISLFTESEDLTELVRAVKAC